MVEEAWRQFLTFAVQGSKELGTHAIMRLEDRAQAQAAKMPAEDGKAFLALVEDERDQIFGEYTRDPEALKKRLGVQEPVNDVARRSNRQSIGETVVKTAVRASIWALIWELFR